MAKNTADYSSKHNTGYEDEQLDHLAQDAAQTYTDFIKELDKLSPEIARELASGQHPLSQENQHAWLDPKSQEKAVAHIRMSFEDAAKDLDPQTREQAAHQLAEKLTEPITYPSRLMAETYETEPDDHANENMKYYATFLKTSTANAHDLMEMSTRQLATDFGKGLANDRDIIDHLDQSESIKEAHINLVAYNMLNVRPQGMNYDQRETHAKALGEALTHPVREHIQKVQTDYTSPLDHYRDHLQNSNDDYAGQTSSITSIIHQLDDIREKQTEQWETELDKVQEELVHELRHTDHGFTEIRQALTDIGQLNQSLDYHSPNDDANDLRNAFEYSIQQEGEEHRGEMARHFAEGITWNYWQQTEGHLADPEIGNMVKTLGHKVEKQAADMADRMTRGQYDADNIRFTIEGVNQARSALENSINPGT